MKDLQEANDILKLYAEKDSTIDNGNLFFAATTYKREYNKCLKNLRKVSKLAQSWMDDYDELKEKYEPSIMVESVDRNRK